MSRSPPAADRRRPGARPLVVLAALLPLAPAWAGERPLFLEVEINGRPTGLVGEFVEVDGVLQARPGEMHALGFRVPPALAAREGDYLPLKDLPGVVPELDAAAQRLRVTADYSALRPTEISAGGRNPAGLPPVAESDWGGVVNYDLLGTLSRSSNIGGGYLTSRVYGPLGTLSVGALGTSAPANGANPLVRLDSTYAFSDPDSLRRYRLGDVVSGGLAWTRPVRLGGGQVASDFGMRPDLVTFPLPQFAGQVAVPSTVDVLVNGVRLASGSTGPGPFAVGSLPIVSGAGTVGIVTRDALGRETLQTLPFYGARSMLTPGLASYSVDMGAVRHNYGGQSDDYRDAAAMGTLRYGVTDWLTMEGHAEASAKLADGGGAFNIRVGTLGVASGSLAGSNSTLGGGGQGGLGFERLGRQFTFGASVLQATPVFRDVAALGGTPPPLRTIRTSIGFEMAPVGALNVTFAAVTGNHWRSGGPEGPPTTEVPRQRASIVSATYTAAIDRRFFVYANAYRDLEVGGATGVSFGLTIPFGPRSVAAASGTVTGREYSGTVQAAQTAMLPGELGWRGLATQGTTQQRQLAEADYRGGTARATLGVDHFNGQVAERAGLQGSIVATRQGVFLAEPIPDSFAIVDTGGQRGVTVLRENLPVGKTDSAGYLLVPELRSFDTNRLGIAPLDLPLDWAVGETARVVRPSDRGGVLVPFAVARSASARIRLVLPDGKPMPLGAFAVLANPGRAGATAPRVPFGYDGETFLSGLAAENRLEVTLPDGSHCHANVSFTPVPDELPLLGPIACIPDAPP